MTQSDSTKRKSETTAFQTEAHRQSVAVGASVNEPMDQAFIDAIGDLDGMTRGEA